MKKLITIITALFCGYYALFSQMYIYHDGAIIGEYEINLVDSIVFNDSNEESPNTIEGALNGSFSISPDKQIHFSKGNLQYQASTGIWRFAEEQYTLMGKSNENISATYDGWIDLLGFGTSGYNDKMPYLWDAPHADFGDGMNSISDTNYDWGVNCAIANGGNEAGLWRTLSADEWSYLLFDRPDAAKLVGAGSVNNQNGLFILPDNWTSLIDFISYADKEAKNDGDYWYYGFSSAFTHNTFSIEEWKVLEAYGVVFLPSSVLRTGTSLMTGFTSAMIDGYYWSTTPFDEEKAYILFFFAQGLRTKTENYRSNGFSVRLVCDQKQ